MGTEHIITIFDREKASGGKKTLVRPSRRPEHIGRRRNGPVINFYDLAQTNTGTDLSPVWTTNPYTKVPTLTFDAGANLTNIEHFYMSDWAAMEDTIFAVPVADWKQTYRRLDYDNAHRYGLDVIATPDRNLIYHKSSSVYSPVAKAGDRRENLAIFDAGIAGYTPSPIVDETRWTQRGLRAFGSGERAFAILMGSMFPSSEWVFRMDSGEPAFNIYWNANPSQSSNGYSVTTVRGDLTGATHALDVSKTMDVYLMPEVYFTYIDYLSDASNKRHILNMLYVVAPRELMLNYRIYDFSTFEPTGAYRYPFESLTSQKRACFADLEDATAVAAFWDWQKTHPNTRYKLCDTIADTVTDETPSSFSDSGNASYHAEIMYMNQQGILMPDGSLKGIVLPWQADPIMPGSGTLIPAYDNTHLLMVINQGANWYYVYSAVSAYGLTQSMNGMSLQFRDPAV